VISFFLFILLIYIASIPSSKIPCPKCNSYAVVEQRGDGSYFKMSGRLCLKCQNRFDYNMDKSKDKRP
jgi:hypothetical protein